MLRLSAYMLQVNYFSLCARTQIKIMTLHHILLQSTNILKGQRTSHLRCSKNRCALSYVA